MKFLIILKSNLKRTIKNKRNLIGSFIIPAIIILGFGIIFNGISDSEFENAIINNDKGIYAQEFIKEIQKTTDIKIYEKDDALEGIKKKRLSVCYEIPENFSDTIAKGEKPEIISYITEKGNNTGNFGFNANSLINKMLLQNQFKQQGIDVSIEELSGEKVNISITGKNHSTMGDIVVLNMLVSFILFGSIGISTDMFQLKRQNVLKRSFTTANRPGTIIGAVLGSLFIVSSVGFIIIFLMNSFISSQEYLSKAPVVIANIIALVLVSLSLGVFITRIFKNENFITMVLQMIISITCFVGGSFMPVEFLPKSITMFSKFTPQYWALQSINKGKPELSLIVVLFALVLFTAGTFKMKNFID